MKNGMDAAFKCRLKDAKDRRTNVFRLYLVFLLSHILALEKKGVSNES